MLLKPVVLKGSLATGFGVGAGPGVPGDPEISRLINKDVVVCEFAPIYENSCVSCAELHELHELQELC